MVLCSCPDGIRIASLTVVCDDFFSTILKGASMKKVLFGFIVGVMTLGLGFSGSSHAINLSQFNVLKIISLKNLTIRKVDPDELYHDEMEECRLEIEHLEDEFDQEYETYRDAADREYDLQREEARCELEYELAWIDLEECEASRETSTGGEGVDTTTEETDEDESSSSSIIDSDLFMVWIHGTCESPRTEWRRETCLGECREELDWWQVDVERIRERNRDVRRYLEERIERCWEDVEEVQREVEECRNVTTEGDDDATTPETPEVGCHGSVNC